MLLPPVDIPIPPGAISLGPYEVLSQTSITNQIKRAMRRSLGFDEYLISVSGSERKADFLANYAGLDKDDRQDEVKLAAALDGLLLTLMDAVDEATNGYPNADKHIMRTLASRSLKSLIGDAMQVFMEDVAAELAEVRKEAHVEYAIPTSGV